MWDLGRRVQKRTQEKDTGAAFESERRNGLHKGSLNKVVSDQHKLVSYSVHGVCERTAHERRRCCAFVASEHIVLIF